LVQDLCVPPAIHVGFAGRQVAARQQPGIEAVVVNLQIPRTGPADLYSGQGENLSHFPGRGGGGSRNGGESGGSGIRRVSGWRLRRAAVQTSSRGTHRSILPVRQSYSVVCANYKPPGDWPAPSPRGH